jgi:hypothetical protein
MRREYLVCYDYGQGGVWGLVRAETPEEIRTKYPELLVAPSRQPWMTDEWMSAIEEKSAYDLDEKPRGLLAAILAQRIRE